MFDSKQLSALISGLLIAVLQGGAALAQDNPLTVYSGPSLAKTVGDVVKSFKNQKEGEVEFVSTETNRLIKAFCNEPSAAQKLMIISRKLTRVEMQNCEKPGSELMGLFVSRYILAPVSNSSALTFDVTPKVIYLGLVDEVPRSAVADSNLSSRKRYELLNATSDSFITNPFQTWKDIDASLPDQQIHFVVPDGGTPKNILDGKLLEAGCRGFKEIKKIFAVDDRARACTLYRQDGRVTLTEGGLFLDAANDILASRKLSIGFVKHSDLRREGLAPLTVNGVNPRDTDFKGDHFALRQEMSVYFFTGPVRGDRPGAKTSPTAAFLTELLSESTIGPSGAFAAAGFYPLGNKDRQDARAILRSVQGYGSLGVN